MGTALGWRNLMRILSGWGVLTLLLMYFIPESLQKAPRVALEADGTAAPPLKPRAKGPCEILCPGLSCAKLRRMLGHADFVGLTGAAAIAMGAVRRRPQSLRRRQPRTERRLVRRAHAAGGCPRRKGAPVSSPNRPRAAAGALDAVEHLLRVRPLLPPLHRAVRPADLGAPAGCKSPNPP